MENHSKQLSIAASAQLAASPAMTLCLNFIANYGNYKDVDAARQILLEEFRNTQCYGTNFCGFVSPVCFSYKENCRASSYIFSQTVNLMM